MSWLELASYWHEIQTPGGIGTSTNGQVLFNSSGSVAGDAGLTYDAGTDTLTAGGLKIPTGAVNGKVWTSDAVGVGSWQAGPAPAAAGADTQVLFNDGGVIAGHAAFTFDKATGVLSATNLYEDVAKKSIAFGGTSLRRAAGGTYNTGFGYNALSAVTTGSYNVGISGFACEMVEDGNENVGIGGAALRRNVSSGGNTAIGADALSYTTAELNTGIGFGAGMTNVTGTKNTFIAGDSIGTNLTLAVAIGIGAKVGSSNTMVLGGTGTEAVNVVVGGTTYSGYGGNFDIRYPYQSRAANVPSQLFVADNGASQAANTGGAIDLGGYQDTYSKTYSFGRIEGLALASTGNGGYMLFRVQNGGGAMAERLRLDANGATAGQYRLSALNTAPANASDTGTLGEIRVTTDAIYVCIATDTWVKTALATW